jgi:hypothetical protein
MCHSLFQIVVITFQLRAASTNDRANIPREPDLSVGRARGDFGLFAPAPTAVLFAFLVFGTTRTFREYMWNLFVPRFIRDKVAARKRRRRGAVGGSVSVVHSAIRGDPEGGNGGNGNAAGLGLQNLHLKSPGRVEEDGKSDEWPILNRGLSVAGRERR